MDQQKEKEQKQMKGKDEENSSHSIANKMALLELEEKHLHRRLPLEFGQFAPFDGVLNAENTNPNETNLPAEIAANNETQISPNLPIRRRLPLEMECEIFQCLKLAIQLKFIWGMGRGIYGMFGPKIRALKKTKRLYNPQGNGWDQFKSDQNLVTIFPDELNVLGRCWWPNVFAKKGFAISGQHCRMDHFPGTILYYYEIIRTSPAVHWGFCIGLSAGSIPIGKYFVIDANSYCIQRASFCYTPGEQLQLAMGDTVGCGLLLSPKNNASIFYTTNGTLIGKPIPISPSVDILFPTLAIHRTSFEANFGDNPEKPFKFDILNCPELKLEFE